MSEEGGDSWAISVISPSTPGISGSGSRRKWSSRGHILSSSDRDGGRSGRFCLPLGFRGGCVYFKDAASDAAAAALRLLGSGKVGGGAIVFRAGL